MCRVVLWRQDNTFPDAAKRVSAQRNAILPGLYHVYAVKGAEEKWNVESPKPGEATRIEGSDVQKPVIHQRGARPGRFGSILLLL